MAGTKALSTTQPERCGEGWANSKTQRCGGTELSTPATIPTAGTGMLLPSSRLEAEELR